MTRVRRTVIKKIGNHMETCHIEEERKVKCWLSVLMVIFVREIKTNNETKIFYLRSRHLYLLRRICSSLFLKP